MNIEQLKKQKTNKNERQSIRWRIAVHSS